MSPIDADESILSEDSVEQDENLKLVPVAESIRYRKRAQGAEKKNEALAQELAQAQVKVEELTEQLGNIGVEQRLMRKLTAAGVVDVEAAVLIAKSRVEGSSDTDLDGVVEQLKKEKQYLFAGNGSGQGAAAQRTAGVKDRMQNGQTVLDRAANKAAQTGNRADLQEYLKLRRNFV